MRCWVMPEYQLSDLQIARESVYYSPNMAQCATLRDTKTKEERLTDPQHLHRIQPAIWVVLHQCPSPDLSRLITGILLGSSKKSIFHFRVHEKRLYLGVMQEKLHLIGNYKLSMDVSFSKFLTKTEDLPIGYFVEMDWEYPRENNDIPTKDITHFCR